MMKIAICDDESSDLKLINEYCTQYNPEMVTSCFSSGEALLAAYEKDFYDLLFLDIEMGKLNGLEVGAILAKRPLKPVIVFTTQSLNYAVHGYGIAIKYLPKPISYDTFSKTMVLALEQIMPQKISVTSNGIQKFVSIKDILYFEVLSHQVSLHLSSGETLSMRSTLSEVIKQIPGRIFVQPHKSYYINMDYIDRLYQQNIVMTNGDIIPIGRSKKDNFQLRLSEYMKGNYLQ